MSYMTYDHRDAHFSTHNNYILLQQYPSFLANYELVKLVMKQKSEKAL